MIYEYLLSRLDTVVALNQQVYPVAVCVDDVTPPLAIYKFQSSDPTKDLNGTIHHWTDTIDVTILGTDYGQIHEIARAVREAVTAVSNLDTGYGEYLFSANCFDVDPESYDLEIQVLSHTVRCVLRWASLID